MAAAARLSQEECLALVAAHRFLATSTPLEKMLAHNGQASILKLLGRRYLQRGARALPTAAETEDANNEHA
jgi:hypothetical protein